MKIKLLPLLLAVACNSIPMEENIPAALPCTNWTVSEKKETTRAGDVESTAKGWQIAVYDSKTHYLAFTAQSNSSSSFSIDDKILRSGRKYNWYMLSGGIAYDRGDGAPMSFPVNESDVRDMRYECPTSLAASLSEYGLDKAGMIGPFSPEDADATDGETDEWIFIPLERLWSKVSLTIGSGLMSNYSLSINSVIPGKGCKVFKPFDPEGYAASAESEMGALPPCSPLTEAQKNGTEPVIIYYPENRQGILLPDNADPYGKSADNVREANPGKEALISTLEIDCSASSSFGVSGEGKYRLCLGGDNLKDFSLERNTSYEVSLSPTDDGLYMDIWKSSFILTDLRSLEFTGIRGSATDDDGPYVRTGPDMPLPSNGRCYAYARYSDGSSSGTDFTLAEYGAAKGWRLSPESQSRLEDAGISFSVDRRKGFASSRDGLFFWNETEFATERLLHGGGGPVYNLSWETVFEFTWNNPSPDNMIIPVTIETFDGKVKATVSIHTGDIGSLSVSGLENARYVGQKGVLSVNSLPAGFSKARFRCSTNHLSISRIDDLSCEISLLRDGSPEVNIDLWNGSSWVGEDPVTGKEFKIRVSSWAPNMRISSTAADLYVDGTPATIKVRYYNSAGEEMMPSSGPQGPNTFVPALFQSYLKPVFTFNGDIASYLGSSDGGSYGSYRLFVNRLTSQGHSISEYTGRLHLSAVRVKAVNCSGVVPRTVDITIPEPFPGAASDRFLGSITHHSLDRGNQDFRISDGSIVTGEAFYLPGGSNAGTSSVTINSGGTDLGFRMESGGRIRTFLKESGTPAEGIVTVDATITNSVSSEVMTSHLGYMEVYLATCLGVRAKAPVEDSMIYDPEVLGSVVRRKAAAILAGVSYANEGGSISAAAKALSDRLYDVKFLKMSNLPSRMSNYLRRQATYMPDYLQGQGFTNTFIPMYINKELMHRRNGTPCNDDIIEWIDYSETVFDFSSYLGAKWYQMENRMYSDPRPPRYAVWTYVPGINVLDRWDSMISSGQCPDRASCFLFENTPNLKVERDVLDSQFSHRDYGGLRLYYDDSSPKGTEGLPYCIFAINRTDDDTLPVFWSECTLSCF